MVGKVRSAHVGRDWCQHSGLWAVVVWLVCLVPAFVVPGLAGESPFGEQGAAVPLVIGLLIFALVAWVVHRWRSGATAGIAAGALSGWAVLVMRTGLYGTPFSYIAGGDTARLSAMAERYSTVIHSADGIVASVPADYPPLFPWVIGRLSLLLDEPAWRLLAPAEIVLASAVLLAGFLLWRRLVSDWLAFAVALVTFAVFLAPAKAYESMALVVVVPWALATFSRDHGRRPLGWLAAGIIGGLQVILYQGYLLFFALGIIALVVIGWRASPDRRAYGWYLVRVVVVAFVVSSWYLIPYFGWDLLHGLQMTDRYQDPLIDASPFPFLTITPVGCLCAIGLVGLLWYRARRWWAGSLIVLTVSAYVYWLVGEIEFIGNGQTLVFQYSVHAVTATFAAAGVLTLATAVPPLLRRLPSAVPLDLGRLVLAVAVLWTGTMAWTQWIPGAATFGGVEFPTIPGSGSAPADSFLQPLPDGQYSRFAPTSGRYAWFPTDPVITDVDAVLGPHAKPLTLSYSEQLFAFEPWPGFIGVGANAAASTSHWFSRLATLQRLARITSPSAFAAASAHTPDGAIDAFVLQTDDHGHWDWTPTNYPGQVRFTPSQFSSSAFVVYRGLPYNTELVIRRGAG